MRSISRLGWSAVLAALLAASALLAVPVAQADRIKDLVRVQGVRDNALIGYGLVVGLDGTGDQTSQAPFTVQSLRSMLTQLGVTIPPGVNPQLKNVAAVAIHGELPPFAKPGQRIDVTVASIGNAKSLRGGSLIATPLRGLDGQMYGVAQGNVVVSGFGAAGSDGSRIAVNTVSAGRIPSGATVERESPSTISQGDHIVLNLHQADFTTAHKIVEKINGTLGDGSARAMDAVSVAVRAPRNTSQRVSFVSVLENIEVDPGEAPARVIVNSRTGTVVIGSNVRVMPAAVAHGSLTVTISEAPRVSQPQPFGEGETVTVPQSEVRIEQDKSRMFLFDAGVSLNEIVQAVNEVGAAPGDLVAILEALKQAGALRAELIVI